MGEIVKSLGDGSYLYSFSFDILSLVRENAHIVVDQRWTSVGWS